MCRNTFLWSDCIKHWKKNLELLTETMVQLWSYGCSFAIRSFSSIIRWIFVLMALNQEKARNGKKRTDIPCITLEDEDKEFVEFIINYNSTSRPTVMELLQKYSHKRIIIFKD